MNILLLIFSVIIYFTSFTFHRNLDFSRSFLQISLELLTKKVEHGHLYHHSNKFPFSLIIGLFTYSLLE